jgi:hypothetical protein
LELPGPEVGGDGGAVHIRDFAYGVGRGGPYRITKLVFEERSRAEPSPVVDTLRRLGAPLLFSYRQSQFSLTARRHRCRYRWSQCLIFGNGFSRCWSGSLAISDRQAFSAGAGETTTPTSIASRMDGARRQNGEQR